MKIACLLGVSDYQSAGSLPACRNDLATMKALIEATGIYDQVFFLEDQDGSAATKQRLVKFFTDMRSQPIEQILFYYTGHGDFDGQEFSYVLSDYTEERRKQTVIENGELDEWLRPLNPQLTVKIVDACKSGVQYIKDPDAFQSYLNVAQKSLNSCYFMFSSKQDQNSYLDDRLSDFTKAVVEAVASFQGTDIRFKDVIDYVSDAFASNARQTPYFVTQAEHTELFVTVSEDVRRAAKEALTTYGTIAPCNTVGATICVENQKTSIVEKVKADAENYCTLVEAMKQVLRVNDFWSEHKCNNDTSELYEFTTTKISHSELPSLSSIGQWLVDNKNDYFASPTYRDESYTEEVEVPAKLTGLRGAMAMFDGQVEYRTKMVSRTRRVLNGFRLTQKIDTPAVRIIAKPRFENLKWHQCDVAYVFSKTELRVFYLFSTLRDLNWDERTHGGDNKWRTEQVALKDTQSLNDLLARIAAEYEAHILDPIYKNYGVDTSEETNTSGSVS